MDALERLVAVREIEDLITRYCQSYDDQDWETFGGLWTEDAAFVVGEMAFEGRGPMLEFLTTCLPEGYASKHMISRPLVELESDTSARARTDVVWIAANFENTIVARYVDTIVKQDGRWLFQRRVEEPMPYRDELPPMSDTAKAVSSPTMRA
ncbi:MAG: nuclear transport factor 2 family protein [Gaiellales bacterium]